MDFIDIRTLLLSIIITNIVSASVMVLFCMQNRKKFAGTEFWILDFAFQAIGFILLALRGQIPDFVSMVVSNTFFVTGILLGYIGILRFLNKKVSQIPNIILIVLFIGIHYWFAVIKPDLDMRNLNISAVELILFFQCVWVLLIKPSHENKKLTRGLGMVFLVLCLISLARIIQTLVEDHSNENYLYSGLFASVLLLAFQIMFIVLTYNLALMFNKYLIQNILIQEEKFSKAFHSATYAILLTRASDGKIFEVNTGFVSISGYSKNEIVDKTTIDLKFWANENDRIEVVKEVEKNGKIYGKELQFRKKNQELFYGIVACEIIVIDNENCIITSINDITDRKNKEEILADSKQFAQATIDALSLNLCVLDETGTIISVNKTWKKFAENNPPVPENYCIGSNYLEICENAKGEFTTEAFPFAKGLRSVIEGKSDTFSLEYPCDSPFGEKRWFTAYVTKFKKKNQLRVLVVHNNISERKLAEQTLIEKSNELERFNNLMVNRELKMIELKKEVNDLLIKSEQNQKYKIS